MKKINVYIGVIGSGKSYRASKENDIVLNYADSLREDIWKLLNWKPQSASEYEIFKNKDLGFITGRELLQNYGQLQKKLNDSYYWAERFEYELAQAIDNPKIKTIGVSDCRFETEIISLMLFLEDQFIESLGVKVQFHFCDYKSDKYDITNTHSSEELAQRLTKKIESGLIDDLDSYIKEKWNNFKKKMSL